jgi:flagellar biosynthesis/type III secretory pathway ATPase
MRKQGSNSNKQLNTQRIRFEKQGNLMVSRLPYSDGQHIVRLIINPEIMMFYITDVLTGHVFDSGGENINNLEVLQRNAKRSLEKFLDSNFIIEKKKRRSE